MNVTPELEDKLFNVAIRESMVNRFLQVVSYGMSVSDKEKGFTDVPSAEDVSSTLESLIKRVRMIIQDGTYVTPTDHFNTDSSLGMLLFMREELIREITYEIQQQVGLISSFDSESLTKELKSIKIYPEKSFLRNVHMNLIPKNGLMKFFTETMIISNHVDTDEVKDLTFEIISNSLPGFLVLLYNTEKFKETKDTKYLFDLTNNNGYIDGDFDEEINESNIRNFIDMIIYSIRENNSDTMKKLSLSLIISGRNQVGKRR